MQGFARNGREISLTVTHGDSALYRIEYRDLRGNLMDYFTTEDSELAIFHYLMNTVAGFYDMPKTEQAKRINNIRGML